MANVYKKPGTKNWYCNYAKADGRRIHRSTGKAKRGEAMAKALEWEQAALKEKNADGEVQRKLHFLVAEAGEMASAGHLTLDSARDLVGRMMEATGLDSPDYYTIEGWFNEWLEQKRGTASKSSLKTYGFAVKRFLESMGESGARGIEHLTDKDIRKFRDAEKKLGKSATTCNQLVKVVRMVLRAAHQRGLIRRNPAEGVPALINTDKVTRKPFTLPELKRLLKKANWEWHGAILLGLYGGLRIKDVTELTWDVVDLKSGVITYMPRKTLRNEKVVVLPVHPTLSKWMKSQRKRLGDTKFVFPSLAERPTGGRQGLSREFIELMEGAKVSRGEVKVSEGGSGRAITVRSFHSLRHTATSLMAKGGVTQEMRMEVVGHSCEDVHVGYTHHEIEALRKAVNSIPNI